MSAALSLRFYVALERETPLVRAVGGVIATCIENSDVHVSTEHIRQRCFERGVVSPTHGSGGKISYGTVARALEALRDAGALIWARAYVRRWHADALPHPEQPRPVRHVDGFRLPARFIALVQGWIERFDARGPMQEAPPPKTAAVSIQPAPDAPASRWSAKLVLSSETATALGIEKA